MTPFPPVPTSKRGTHPAKHANPPPLLTRDFAEEEQARSTPEGIGAISGYPISCGVSRAICYLSHPHHRSLCGWSAQSRSQLQFQTQR